MLALVPLRIVFSHEPDSLSRAGEFVLQADTSSKSGFCIWECLEPAVGGQMQALWWSSADPLLGAYQAQTLPNGADWVQLVDTDTLFWSPFELTEEQRLPTKLRRDLQTNSARVAEP